MTRPGADLPTGGMEVGDSTELPAPSDADDEEEEEEEEEEDR